MLQDLRFALRGLWKNPALATVAILTLALGIGATSALWSVIHAVLLRPLPLPEPDRLMVVWGYHPEIGTETASLPDFVDWRQESASFQELVAYFRQSQTLTGGETPERIRGARVSRGYFEMLGVRPQLGRLLRDEEDEAGAPRVAVISHGLWQRHLGGESSAVGQVLRLNGEPFEVVGVAPPDFDFPTGTEVWRPLALDASQLGRRSDFLTVVGRLAPGIDRLTAQEEMVTLMARLEATYPATNSGWSARVVPIHEELVGFVRPRLYILLGAVGFVLLMACVNVANLLLARSSTRQGELVVRVALGAGRGRLLRQLLLESLVLAAGGGVAGLALALGGVEALKAFGPQDLPRLETVRVDAAVLAFTGAVALGTGFLFGLLPAFSTIRNALWGSLHDGGRSGTTVAQTRLRSVLVSAQVSIAIVLLTGAGLLMRSFQELGRTEVGFQVEGMATVEVALPRTDYPEDAQVLAFFTELVDRAGGLPGVLQVGGISHVPVRDGAPYLSFAVQGRPPVDPAAVQDAEVLTVTPGTFETLGIPLLRGRVFGAQDRADGELVAVINQRMAQRYWPGADPLGGRLTLADATNGPWARIVGVVGDTKQSSLDGEPYPQLYLPLSQNTRRAMSLMVRTRGEAAVVAGLRQAVADMDPNLPVFNTGNLTDILAETLAQPRFNSYLLLLFAAVALVLTSVGLYGVLAFLVGQRNREIGLRMALGADPARVFALVLVRGAVLVGSGTLVGIALALAASQFLGGLLYGVSPLDPLTYVVVPLVLTLVSALAMWTPAYRASRVDPVVALRQE